MIRTALFIKFTQTKITQITSNGCTDKLCYIHTVEYWTVMNINKLQSTTCITITKILNERTDMEEYIVYHLTYVKFKNSSTLPQVETAVIFREKGRGSELERDFWGAGNVLFIDLHGVFKEVNNI